MRRVISLASLCILLFGWTTRSEAACPGCKAERITTTTANSLLFGGTDSAGGVGDWYLTNGTLVAIIDDIGTTSITTAGGSSIVDITSSNAVETGGTLIDLGLKGKHNDQFPQAFNTGGTSLANVFIFRQGDETAWGVPAGNNPCTTIGGSNPLCPLEVADADCAAITVYGVMLGACNGGNFSTQFCSTRSAPRFRVRTTYKACNKSRTLGMRTEVWNHSGPNPSPALPIFDVILWGGRGLAPFAAGNGRGFSHPQLNLSNIAALLTDAPYFVAAGNNDTKDGTQARGKKAGTVSYGYVSDGVIDDSNGPTAGGTLTVANIPFQISSIQSPLLSAAAPSATLAAPLGLGRSRIYSRRMIVGARNDVASVAGDKKNPESILATSALASALGTVQGKLSPGSPLEGSVTFIRTGGPDLAMFGVPSLNTAPISQVRFKGAFNNVQLPHGIYTAHFVVPGRDDVVLTGINVTAAANTVIAPVVAPKAGKLKIEVRDADLGTGIPAKVSLSPNPFMRRDFAAFTYSINSGMCSNNLSTDCTLDGDCGGGNTCFRTCSTEEPPLPNPGCPVGYMLASDGKCRRHGCNSDADCVDNGGVCRGNTESALPESYPGIQKGGGQAHVIYLDKKGKALVDLKPGTYTLTISRGPEYTIRQVNSVAVSAGATTDAGVQTIKRVVDTTGYLSADFHIHSGRSFDSSVPLESRVRSYAGEGVEVMVSTDHDIVSDYAPIIKKLGVAQFVTSIIGSEVTNSVARAPYLSNGWGHLNSWPTELDPNARRSGAIEDESVSASTLFDRLRAQSNLQCVGGKKNGLPCTTNSHCGGAPCTDVGEQVIQLNHPRAGVAGVTNIGIFDNIGFNPAADIADCQKYPVTCSSSICSGGTNDGTSCMSDATCTGGGRCACNGGSIPGVARGCNQILLDQNVIPETNLCTTPPCSGNEGVNGTRNIDADVMEIDNGGGVGGYGNLKLMRRDWLSLLNQGVQVGKNGSRHPMWGTGVSDSHRLVHEVPGYSRTYVGAGELPVTTPLNIKAFNEQVLGGNMMVTSGPFISLQANSGGPDVGIGSTLGPSVGSVNLKIKVQAPPWIPVDEVRIIQNGCVVACYNATTTPAVAINPVDPFDQTAATVVRFDTTSSPINLPVTEDSYFIVEASPNLPMSGNPAVNPVVNEVARSVFPFSFTNPVFADFSGDGEYTGIGLSPGSGEPVCPALPIDCSAGAAVASVAAPVMVAQAPRRSFLSRLFAGIIGTAEADDDRPANLIDDSERLEENERELRQPHGDHAPPWHLIVIPTPAATPVQ